MITGYRATQESTYARFTLAADCSRLAPASSGAAARSPSRLGGHSLPGHRPAKLCPDQRLGRNDPASCSPPVPIRWRHRRSGLRYWVPPIETHLLPAIASQACDAAFGSTLTRMATASTCRSCQTLNSPLHDFRPAAVLLALDAYHLTARLDRRNGRIHRCCRTY